MDAREVARDISDQIAARIKELRALAERLGGIKGEEEQR